MDIKPPINSSGPPALTKPADNLVHLKVGQTLNVTVISTTSSAESTALTLNLDNKPITLHSSQPVKLDPGQSLQIQLTKTTPALEFKILNASPLSKLPAALLSLQATPVQLQEAGKNLEQSFDVKQQLTVKIIGLDGNKIQMQILTLQPASHYQEKSAETVKQSSLITLERSQLATESLKTPETFKIGQILRLVVTNPGMMPSFKLLSVALPGPTEKITELLKQILPRHQSAPELLNQLIKDLPQLLTHESLPQSLKSSILAILHNLPQSQQLMTNPGLKQALDNSGLFLEARLGLLTETPELALAEDVKADFKANLLKLVQLLQQEVSTQAVKNHQDTDLALLKNMQQKTENTLAKIVLNQLLSLPKEDNPKQIWHLELPFLDRDNAETVDLEIQQDKDADRHPDSGNWSVNITLTPPGLGSIHCAISFREHMIHTHFRSQETQTTELIRRNLDYLKAQFEQSGLTPGQMNAQDGHPKTKPALPIAEAKLFDDKA